jgi:hypothetical protein
MTLHDPNFFIFMLFVIGTPIALVLLNSNIYKLKLSWKNKILLFIISLIITLSTLIYHADYQTGSLVRPDTGIGQGFPFQYKITLTFSYCEENRNKLIDVSRDKKYCMSDFFRAFQTILYFLGDLIFWSLILSWILMFIRRKDRKP